MKEAAQEKFELGPIQKEWLRRLRAHPERQLFNKLGEITDLDSGIYQACCLGEGLITLKAMNGETPDLAGTELFDGSPHTLDLSYDKLGLRTCGGEFKNTAIQGDFESLADMNDREVTWPEIADYIEANPENVFTKSV